MGARPDRRRLREITVSALTAAAAMLVIAVTATPQGLAVAGSPLGPDAHDELTMLSAPVPEQVVDDTAHVSGTTLPVDGYTITARFGERGAHWRLRHTGLDFKAPWGTPVRAVVAGTVIKLAVHPAYGRMVILRVAPGVTVWYCHLSAILARLGPVKAGQVLGRVGQTGNATGPHLHLEVRVHDRPTDPAVFLFAASPGHPGPVPAWYPSVPSPTVASLPSVRAR